MDSAKSLKIKGFAFMFLSSSLMGGIGAFARYINTSGDVISFTRNFSGLICMFFILLAITLVTNRLAKATASYAD